MVFDLSANESNRRVFRDKISLALRNFLNEDSDRILQKQLAAYLNVDPRTVRSWLICEHEPTAFQIGLIAKIMGKRFLNEIYGEFFNAQTQTQTHLRKINKMNKQYNCENINDFCFTTAHIDFDKSSSRFAIEDIDTSRATIEFNQEN